MPGFSLYSGHSVLIISVMREMREKSGPAMVTELHTGIAGNGSTKYMVVTVDAADGRWLHIESFATEAEALHWIKWACSAPLRSEGS
jgi:hypothetical protein